MPRPTTNARCLDRRLFLKGAGVAVGLPLLDAMTPAFADSKQETPRRLVAIEANMSFLPQFFFPESPGRDYELTPYLSYLKDFQKEMTVFSGVSHPDVDGGHAAEPSFLTAAPHPGRGGFKNTISLDQYAAEQIGIQTRFPSLTLAVSNENKRSLSFTRSGVQIPAEHSPSALYRQMFVRGSEKETQARIEELRAGRSILDFVNESAKKLNREIGPRDRQRLDQYFTSVRDLEDRLLLNEKWEHRPKPKVEVPEPKDIADRHEVIGQSRLMFDMVRLALETDSTRLITVFINTATVMAGNYGVNKQWHALTHHGRKEENIAELRKLEELQFEALAGLLTGLKESQEDGQTLLDRTMVFFGGPMGSANAHTNFNLPVLLAGGGFRHGGHLAFDTQRNRNYPLPNLFVSMLQRLGIETDRFATSTGTMTGLEMTS